MANEAVIVELLGDPKGKPVSYLCSNGTGIEKGALLWFEDNRMISGTAIADVGSGGKPFAGIAAHEKVASDGSTHIGCWTCGIFDLYCDKACKAGNKVCISGQNTVTPVVGIQNISGNHVVGSLLEDATAGETVQVAVGIY